MGVLDKIEKKDIRDLLGKGWLTHDGLWFYHTCQELGIERANALNQAAIKSLAPIEIERAKRILGMDQEKINDFARLMDFLLAALELTLPDSVFKKARFSSPSKRRYTLGMGERAMLRLQGDETDRGDRWLPLWGDVPD